MLFFNYKIQRHAILLIMIQWHAVFLSYTIQLHAIILNHMMQWPVIHGNYIKTTFHTLLIV